MLRAGSVTATSSPPTSRRSVGRFVRAHGPLHRPISARRLQAIVSSAMQKDEDQDLIARNPDLFRCACTSPPVPSLPPALSFSLPPGQQRRARNTAPFVSPALPCSVLPMWAGGFGFLAVLANRAFSDVAPVLDSSSAQSRADVLGIVMSAILFLTGKGQEASQRGLSPRLRRRYRRTPLPCRPVLALAQAAGARGVPLGRQRG